MCDVDERLTSHLEVEPRAGERPKGGREDLGSRADEDVEIAREHRLARILGGEVDPADTDDDEVDPCRYKRRQRANEGISEARHVWLPAPHA